MILQALGTASGYPTFHRASTSFLIRDKNLEILIDAGSKHILTHTSRNLTDIFITHTHIDHFAFLGMLVAKFKDYPITIHCMKENVPAVNLMIDLFTPFKTKHVVRGFDVVDYRRLSKHVYVARSKHDAYCSCYSFDFNKKISFVFDTEALHEPVLKLAKGSDYLIHECTNLKGWRRHSPPEGAALDARISKSKNLILTHFKKIIMNKETVKRIRKFYKGRLYFAYDLRKFKLT